MDIISHGLWGGIAFGRKSRKSFWLSFAIGISPDIFSFGVFWLATFFGISQRPDWKHGPPDISLIPGYVGNLYNITHSLIIFALVFTILWIIFKRPVWEIGAWGLHVLVDVFSHSYRFFPTPFLWPVSDFKINAIGWGDPRIFFPNLILLLILYSWFFIAKMRERKKWTKNKY